jgi:hypothetical protein
MGTVALPLQSSETTRPTYTGLLHWMLPPKSARAINSPPPPPKAPWWWFCLCLSLSRLNLRTQLTCHTLKPTYCNNRTEPIYAAACKTSLCCQYTATCQQLYLKSKITINHFYTSYCDTNTIEANYYVAKLSANSKLIAKSRQNINRETTS